MGVHEEGWAEVAFGADDLKPEDVVSSVISHFTQLGWQPRNQVSSPNRCSYQGSLFEWTSIDSLQTVQQFWHGDATVRDIEVPGDVLASDGDHPSVARAHDDGR